MTFDRDLWPTDLNINRDHLLMQDYLPTKFEASEAKRSWVIRCTRFGRLTWPNDLDLWPTDLNINRDHLLIKDYLPIKFEASWTKRSWVISCTSLRDGDLTFDLDLWPTDLNINRDHLLIKDNLPSLKLLGQSPWVINCTRLRDTDIPTDMCNAICLLLYVQRNMPSSSKGVINMCVSNDVFKYIRVGSRNFLFFLRSHGQTVFFFQLIWVFFTSKEQYK